MNPRVPYDTFQFSRLIPSATWVSLQKLVELAGLEPATIRLWVGGSNQLSYGSTMVAGVRLELTTSRVWTVLSSQLRYPARSKSYLAKFYGRDDRIWTCDPLVPNQVHYQTVLHPVNGGACRIRTNAVEVAAPNLTTWLRHQKINIV